MKVIKFIEDFISISLAILTRSSVYWNPLSYGIFEPTYQYEMKKSVSFLK